MRNTIQRVAAVHDLSGFGRVSLTAVIPVLSNMGIQVCPLPTAVLSAHSQFREYSFVDLTINMQAMINHWKALKISFDSIYSGYLGSPEQVDILMSFIADFKKDDQIVVVDPVLGDNGKRYSSLRPEMVPEMRRLIQHADVITPNITELFLLLDKPFDPEISREKVQEYLVELAGMGPGIVIVTSVPEPSTPKSTSVIALNKEENRFWKVSCNYLPANYPGTGDAFTSVITGALLQGDSLPIALDRAVQFISIGVRATFGHAYDPKDGILLERVLHQLDAPVNMSSYELLD
jgi:pyridoxine kinase